MKAGLISPNLYYATLAGSLIAILADTMIFRFLKAARENQPTSCDAAVAPASA
jgi:hypothetical protein